MQQSITKDKQPECTGAFCQ